MGNKIRISRPLRTSFVYYFFSELLLSEPLLETVLVEVDCSHHHRIFRVFFLNIPVAVESIRSNFDWRRRRQMQLQLQRWRWLRAVVGLLLSNAAAAAAAADNGDNDDCCYCFGGKTVFVVVVEAWQQLNATASEWERRSPVAAAAAAVVEPGLPLPLPSNYHHSCSAVPYSFLINTIIIVSRVNYLSF